jgi:hypothetical protein
LLRTLDLSLLYFWRDRPDNILCNLIIDGLSGSGRAG